MSDKEMKKRWDKIIALESEKEKERKAGLEKNQKLKAYLILSLLQKKTDKNHVLNATEIADAITT